MISAIQQINNEELNILISSGELGTISDEAKVILDRSVTNSIGTWIGTVDGRTLCLWGLIAPSILSDRAYLWMLHSPHLARHMFIFVRHSKIVVEEMLKRYPLIVGHYHVDAERSRRWIEWLGGKFGVANGPMIPFEIVRK